MVRYGRWQQARGHCQFSCKPKAQTLCPLASGGTTMHTGAAAARGAQCTLVLLQQHTPAAGRPHTLSHHQPCTPMPGTAAVQCFLLLYAPSLVQHASAAVASAYADCFLPMLTASCQPTGCKGACSSSRCSSPMHSAQSTTPCVHADCADPADRARRRTLQPSLQQRMHSAHSCAPCPDTGCTALILPTGPRGACCGVAAAAHAIYCRT